MATASLAHRLAEGLVASACVALMLALALLAKSLKDFSQTGPQLRKQILDHYRTYAVFAVLRLIAWVFLLCTAMGFLGAMAYVFGTIAFKATFHLGWMLVAAALGVMLVTGLQFCRHLLYLPASVAVSYHYRKSRLYPIWKHLSESRLRWATAAVVAAACCMPLAAAGKLATQGQWVSACLLSGLVITGAIVAYALFHEYAPAPKQGTPSTRPNILMIGSDTLRADRLGGAGYPRRLTPFIDALAARGTLFEACYVPCARTAPSLLSLLTGTWPHTHGVRDNFIADSQTRLPVVALPEMLAKHGYRTAAVSDWSGGDLRKFQLGFEHLDLPEDQWNIKYLMRQGPKDVRLFLSLFTHSRFGKWALPELYYLAGVPLTSLVGRDARALISTFASQGQPFFLNVFASTTHPPFGSEYPYYTLWSDKHYAGESKFVMARVTDPWEIIRRQGDSKKEFDLDQIIDLYDGCVQNFDDEVRHIVEHVKACGLEENTIIVIYSDHGMEFFEHDTWGQGNSVRGDFSARIPLVIVDPRIGKNTICPHIVRSIDVAPTLMELAGLAPLPDAEGVSLVPYLSGAPVDMNLAAFNETGIWLTDMPGMPPDHLRYPNLLELLEVPDRNTGTLAIKPEFQQVIIDAKDRMIRVGRWKLIYQPTSNGPLIALFDVATDPECRHDLAAAHVDVVDDLLQRLSDWIHGAPVRQPRFAETASK